MFNVILSFILGGIFLSMTCLFCSDLSKHPYKLEAFLLYAFVDYFKETKTVTV